MSKLRETLEARILRRHKVMFQPDRLHQLEALRSGRRVTVDAPQLASALYEAGMIDAEGLYALKSQQKLYVVEPSGKWHPLDGSGGPSAAAPRNEFL